MPYYYPRGINNERMAGPLLPFLAGVLVTTPFIYFAKDKNQPNTPIYQNPYYQAPPYPYYPQQIPYYPQQPYYRSK